MSDLKTELTRRGKAFSFEPMPQPQQFVCPHYTKAAFGMTRCMGSSISGKCGHPTLICPIPKKLSDILEVD